MPRVILSRKGFDGESGRAASPIFDNKFFSFPIPRGNSGVHYRDLHFWGQDSYWDVMRDLNITHFSEAHLDPDLRKNVIKHRHPGWRPIFGQGGSADGVLQNQGISKGDIFLFFGWFRHVVQNNGRYTYVKGTDVHAIFGYLEVAEVIDLNEADVRIPVWAATHPHVAFCHEYLGMNNHIYIATESCSFARGKPGGASFCYDDRLVLTLQGENKSVWRLPSFFQENRFHVHTTSEPLDHGYSKYMFKGMSQQEFYIDDAPEVVQWAQSLIQELPTFD